MLLAPGLGTAPAQVRPIVLEDPSYRLPKVPPSRLPRREVRVELLWQVESGGTVVDGLLSGPGGVIYAVREGSARALSPDDGQLMWERRLGTDIRLPPAGIQGRLFLITEGMLHALATDRGLELWKSVLPAPATSPPVVAPGIVLVAMEGPRLGAYSISYGAELWRRDLECNPSSSPGTGDGLLVLGCEDGQLLGLSVSTGQTLWQRNIGSRILAPPIVHDERVFLTTDSRQVVVLGAGKGRRRYAAHLAADPGSAIATPGALLLVGAMDNLLYGLRARGGHLVWTADIGTRGISPPALRGNLAVSSPLLSSEIVAIDLRDGAILGRPELPGQGRLSAAGPVFAGSILIHPTRPQGGGPGWLTGFAFDVEEIGPPPGQVVTLGSGR